MKLKLYFAMIICVFLVFSCVSSPQPAKDVVIKLLAVDAQLETDMDLVYEESAECVGWWSSPNDIITWDLNIEVAGNYQVQVVVSCDPQFPGSTVGVTIGDQKKTFIMPDTGAWSSYSYVEVGTYALEAKSYKLAVQGVTLINRFYGNLQRVVLTKI
ncbi:MAG: hypothetical protein JXJ04_03105 [Spirochaetales bacterium]|nr:hypothetical protein [Spirochaetales bacterium]